MTEIQRTNIDFAKNFLELIGPRVGNGVEALVRRLKG